LNIGSSLTENRAAKALIIAAILLRITGASAAIGGQSPTITDDANAKTPPAGRVSANPHWSLPFDGRLKGLPDPASEHHGSSITVLHLDDTELPSAVTLTPPPSGQADTSAKPVQEVETKTTVSKPESGIVGDTKVTTPTTANIPPAAVTNASSPASQKPQATPVNEDQVVKLKPPIGDQSLKPESTKKIITGEVSTWDGPIKVDRIIESLVDKTFANSPEGEKLDKQLKHLSSPSQKAISVTKDSMNDAVGYQGFDPSARAGKLILDDGYKVRNRAWAEYERQKYVDKIHLQVVSGMMQIAEALGIPDTERASQVMAAGQDSLNSLVGKDEAARTVQGLRTWLSHVPPAESSFSQVPWNTIERNKKLESVLKEALKQDQVVGEVTKKIERYAHPGKLKAGTSRVVETTLNAISILGPGFAIPLGAEVMDTAYKQSSGGSEENKLERELLLDKRVQSRLKVLSQEASMALDNYRFALVTKNPPLLVFSEEVLGNMTGKSNLPKLVSAQTSTSTSPPIVPDIKESKKK
jgi:hypothetical protein